MGRLKVVDGILYTNGEMICRGDDYSVQVEESYDAEHPYRVAITTAHRGVVAIIDNDVNLACLLAQLLEYARLNVEGWPL